MKDYLGRDMSVGDYMVLPCKGSSSVYLKLCRITGFTPKGRILFVRYGDYACDTSYTGRDNECILVPEDAIDLNKRIKMESLFQKERAYNDEKARFNKLVPSNRSV